MKHREIAKLCPEYISLVVMVSSFVFIWVFFVNHLTFNFSINWIFLCFVTMWVFMLSQFEFLGCHILSFVTILIWVLFVEKRFCCGKNYFSNFFCDFFFLRTKMVMVKKVVVKKVCGEKKFGHYFLFQLVFFFGGGK